MNFPDNNLSLARNQLIKDIRLTQNLALLEDKFLDRNNSSDLGNINRSKFWFKSFWQISFQKATSKKADKQKTLYYTIYSDYPDDKYSFKLDNNATLYLDSLTKKYMIGNWKGDLSGSHSKDKVTTNLNLSLEYGITYIDFIYIKSKIKGRKNKLNIFFDNFGRPYVLQTKDKKKLNPSSTNNFNNFEKDTTLHPFEYLLQEPVQIKLVKNQESVCFNLEPISGYLHIETCNF